MARSLGLVVPAYRPDPQSLADYVRALDERLDPVAIRVELDAPRPGVGDALADLPSTLSVSRTRRGKGAAITAGFQALDEDVLAFADADGSTPADSIGDVVAPVRAGEADLVTGSRRHPDATVLGHQTFVRRRLGDAFARVAGRLLEVRLTDYQCGVKAISRPAWSEVRYHLYERGFAWDVELIAMAAALGLRVTEVPIVWEDRPVSTVSPVRTSLAMGRGLLSARHRARLLRGHPVHGALGALPDGRRPLVPRPERADD